MNQKKFHDLETLYSKSYSHLRGSSCSFVVFSNLNGFLEFPKEAGIWRYESLFSYGEKMKLQGRLYNTVLYPQSELMDGDEKTHVKYRSVWVSLQ